MPPPPAPGTLDYPVAGPARRRGRHLAVTLSFFAFVALPVAVTAWYLWARAADQYASRVAFSVRAEEQGPAIELLGGITELSGASSSDTDILYDFLQSQDLVQRTDRQLDLRAIWSRADPAQDPVFAFHGPGTIEDLVEHWNRMVRIGYDTATGLIDIRVLAFDPEEARSIARAIQTESSAMINDLSVAAREDAIGYARAERDRAEDRLSRARVALTAFRTRTRIVDPTIDTEGRMGLVATLQAQLAEALIELDLLRDTTRASDPRIEQAERRIEVIEDRIEAERAQIGAGGDGTAFADLVEEYERLVADKEFAQEAWVAALAAYDLAVAEAQRQSRYLAAHIRPTLAEAAEYPDRPMILGLVAVFLFLAWSALVLIGYALRDRR
ncbi:capsule biosynthesis protein [Rhodobacterales bacterium HKCCE2091]|nr:capsule biosynthesis protein [Rhodobacterales bacterium HKCCE2091]